MSEIIDTPQFKLLFTNGLNLLIDIFKRHNYEIRFVGGVVRDLLIGKPHNDVDLATTATREQLIYMFNTEKIKINKGISSYSTITCYINREKFEISSLKTTDEYGYPRHTYNWIEDAEMRDLTINSMFLDLNGKLYDYFNGREDLLNGIIKFVINPFLRIKEDVTRILRYFRFFCMFSKIQTHDNDVIQAIKKNASILSLVRKSIIWYEIKKLVKCPNIRDVIEVMTNLGINTFIGFPININFDELDRVSKTCLSFNSRFSHITIIMTMINNDEEFNILRRRVNIARRDIILGKIIIKYRNNVNIREDNLLNWCCHLSVNEDTTKYNIIELLKYCNLVHFIDKVNEYDIPYFPIDYNNLSHLKFSKHHSYAKVRNYLREKWIDSDYTLTKKQLLDLVKS